MKVLILSLLFGVSFADILDLNNECEGILFGALPHPDPTQFIGCVQGRGTIFGCDFGLIFDPIKVQCVEEALLTTTDNSHSTTFTEPIVTTEPVTTTSWLESTTTSRPEGDGNVRFRCPSSGNGLIPHDNNCSAYYECINSVRNLRLCNPIEYHYDVLTRTCRPADEAMCSELIRCIN
ncbi:hypothetical protein PVAND_003869 [Polypedilum vanderplanki]|uniref:Chitin-binding type-2 domain-containing protein n=1 Tax=Polypedilum vanderplanki TaxID=319348 RepID=A0A9J6BVV8_POLVA|nr:hypothetical protein PVAND_003869 [Polypedilum vanderplanki]